MSSILPFVVVAAALAIVAWVALGEAPQPATTDDRVPRAPWPERVQAVLHRILRAVQAAGSWLKRTMVVALTAEVANRRRERAEKMAERRATIDEPTSPVAGPAPDVTREAPEPDSVERAGPVKAAAPDGVLTTALLLPPDPAVGDVAGERVVRVGPSPLTRLRSALGLVALIVVLGLGLAAVIGAAIALGGAALDSFVN